jgi:hypothetical protein
MALGAAAVPPIRVGSAGRRSPFTQVGAYANLSASTPLRRSAECHVSLICDSSLTRWSQSALPFRLAIKQGRSRAGPVESEAK